MTKLMIMADRSNQKTNEKDLEKKIEKLISESELKKQCYSLESWQKNILKIEGFEQAEKFSEVLGLVSNPFRLKMLFILLERDWCCSCEFEYLLEIHQTLVSHHLKILREGGIISYRKVGKWRFYSLTEPARPFILRLRELLTCLPNKK